MKNRLSKFAGFSLSLAMVVGFSLPANAAVIFGVAGSSFQSSAHQTYIYRLGKGYSGNFRYVTVAVNDNDSSTYFTRAYLISCDVDDWSTCNGVTTQRVAMEAATGYNYYAVTTTGVGKRSITFDFYYSCANLGDGCGGTNSTGSVSLNSAKYYFFVFNTMNAKTGATLSGNTSVYGIQPTLTTVTGESISCNYNAPGITLCEEVGTPYHYFTDTVPSELDVGFYNITSESSQLSLSGASTFCAGVASTSTAFGIPYGLCYIGGFLFIPSQDAIDSFFTSASIVKQKAPWSYATAFLSAWDTASSTSVSFVNVSIPWDAFTQTSTSLTIISSASFTRWVSSSTLNTLRGFTTAAFYVSFAFYLWRRGRNVLTKL